MDLYSRDIIRYTISESPNINMVMEMLEEAIVKQDDIKGLVIHKTSRIPISKCKIC